ncbi:type VI secretion system protein TssL, long form [Burkholderia ubonensis]|uniref:type VI secretion system protein TssL, long form n=1 Tax=Burkholderia ubonensis TaxID=101571 RepID=UPI00075DC06C|nr:type VI secretion system protein TssL, long form [Burkholderia ubonensis]KWB82958.1 hypothetical protein WL42_07300 [Burkholderia ubonensis]
MHSPTKVTHVQGPAVTEFEEQLAAVKRAKNPLLEAASTLLRAQADIPGLPDDMSFESAVALRDLLIQRVLIFEALCTQANIRRDHMTGAKYCLCTALDEIAMQSAWGKDVRISAEWAEKSLATTFHEDRKGGEKIYFLIARLLTEAHEHLDLLEVIYRILSFGFEGRYRFGADGKRKHDAIRQRLYDEITAQRGVKPVALSPHWQSNVKATPLSVFEFPIWIMVTVLSVILLGVFGWFKYELMTRSAEVQKQIAAIGRVMPQAHQLPAPSMPPATPTLHLKQLLKGEIALGTVSVDEDAQHSAVTFRGDAMFEFGGASVKASMGPLIAKIAGEIVKVPGKVTVLGYTDNVPIRSGQFASNQALSEERATQVMQMLKEAGVPANRLEAVGRGDADPLGDNRTAQGRAQNRRVELVVGLP